MESVIHFGECTLYLGERRLECRGHPVKLGSRALDLLAVLAQRKGEVVSSRDLMEHAWPKIVVTDSSLRVHIGELRRALSAVSANSGSLILNIPGRGYQLALPRAPGSSQLEVAPTFPPRSLLRELPLKGRVFGREFVLHEVLRHLGAHSIVALVGPGGMGKTTVAQMVLQDRKAAGFDTLWVDLSSLASDSLVAAEVVRAAGIGTPGDATATLVKLLRSRSGLLLILDCCDRVVAGAASLAEYLARQIPGLRVLATSREALHADGERVVRLPPLGVEAVDATDPTARGPAVELFMARALAADLDLQLPQAIPSIERICRGLDGIPLAIELAAAHLVGFGLDDLASLIDSGFQLGGLGLRTGSERHRTLEATFEWSYQLLDDAQRQALEWLAVFEGGASLQAVLAVLAGTEQSPTQIAHNLAGLVDKSLVKLVDYERGSYYCLHDTTRAFAAKRLRARQEVLAARLSHAQYMLREVAGVQVEGRSLSAMEWFGPRGPNLANLRAALTWAGSEPSARSLAIALSAASAPAFLQLSLLDECERNCERALALISIVDGSAHAAEATKLMAYQGSSMLGTRGPVDECLEVLTTALAKTEAANDSLSRALVLSGLFWLWIYRGEPTAAVRAANALFEARGGDMASMLLRDGSLAYASSFVGDQQDALVRLVDVQQKHAWSAQGQFMRIGSAPSVFHGVFMIKTHWLRGETDQARELYQRLLPSLQKPEHGLYYCWALNEVMIPMHCFMGDWLAAQSTAEELVAAATRQSVAVRKQAAGCALIAIDLLQGKGDLGAYLESVSHLRRQRFASLLPWLDGVAALAALAHGQIALALQLMDSAVLEADRTGCRWWLAELHRIRGLCFLANASTTDFQQSAREFRRACEIAELQHAAALELHAAVEWGRSLPEGLDAELRERLEGSLARAPEMAGQALAVEAIRLLGLPVGESASSTPYITEERAGRPAQRRLHAGTGSRDRNPGR